MSLPPARPGGSIDIDTVETKEFLKRIGDIFVLARKQMRPALQNGHPASEAGERLREFQAYVAAAQDDQMAGKPIKFERLDVRERFGGAKARDIRNGRVSAEVQEH